QCGEYGKSIRKEQMEAEFLEIVRSLKPSPKLFYLALDIFDRQWKDRQEQANGKTKTIKQQGLLIDRKVGSSLTVWWRQTIQF
ncbi:MAG: hypothetical protein KA099_12540, partial [Alphaproteobacteria bacterium]|nr:hypothetical protein [Alphaproteobacteria bacterium]